MQDRFELLRTRCDCARCGNAEDLVHLVAKARNRIRNEATGLIERGQRPHRRLVELLHLLRKLVDRFERTADVALDRAEYLTKDIEDAGMGAYW